MLTLFCVLSEKKKTLANLGEIMELHVLASFERDFMACSELLENGQYESVESIFRNNSNSSLSPVVALSG